MIISYKGHQSVQLLPGQITVLATNNQTVFKEMLSGIKGYNDLVRLVDDDFKSLETAKYLDCDSNILITRQLYEQYSRQILTTLVNNLTEDKRNHINRETQQLLSFLQEALFMTNLPVEINYNGELKKLIKLFHPCFDPHSVQDPYDIIINDLKIHLECNLKSVTCFSNVANYLSQEEFSDLLEEVALLNVPLFLIEFTEFNHRDYYRNADVLYIDEDFVDLKL